jgi:hypothetical protein
MAIRYEGKLMTFEAIEDRPSIDKAETTTIIKHARLNPIESRLR